MLSESPRNGLQCIDPATLNTIFVFNLMHHWTLDSTKRTAGANRYENGLYNDSYNMRPAFCKLPLCTRSVLYKIFQQRLSPSIGQKFDQRIAQVLHF